MIAELDVRSLNRRPCGPVSDFFLPAVPRMRGKAVVEGLAIDGLGMRWQVTADREGEVVIRAVGHVALG